MHADNWAIKAKRMGYRSRAVFKLEEILDKLHSHKTYKNVLDLGSAPGGWSQYISLMHPKTKIFAIDLLDMDLITVVTFIKDDIGNIDDINIKIIPKYLTKDKFSLKNNSPITGTSIVWIR